VVALREFLTIVKRIGDDRVFFTNRSISMYSIEDIYQEIMDP
jgi:hypothetical protein